MCELPARSMPGSEMLLVLKTRMRGSYGWPSGASAPVMSLHLLDKETHVAGFLDHAEVLVAHLLGPGGEVLGGATVGGLDLHDPADGDARDALLGGEDRAVAAGAASVDDLLCLDGAEVL